MKRSRFGFGLTLAVVCALLVPAMASAQSDDVYTRWGGMRDRLNINAGAFFVGHDTFALLRPSGSDIPGVNIEQDTGAGYNYASIDVQLQIGDVLQRDFEYRYKFRGPVVYGVLSF